MIQLSGFKNKETENIEMRYNSYSKCEYLLIDDLFSLGTTSYWKANEELVKAEWDKILRYRANRLFQTAITSCYNITYIEEHINSNIASLLKSCYKELVFDDCLNEVLMKRIDNIFEV